MTLNNLMVMVPVMQGLGEYGAHLHCHWGCPRGVMVKAMSCGIVVRKFVLQSRYYVHFRANTLGKGMNPLFSLQLWVNSRTDQVLQPWGGNQSRRRKTLNSKPVKLRLKIDIVSYPARAEGLVNSTFIVIAPGSTLAQRGST